MARLRRWGILLAFYALVAGLSLYPLLFHAATHVAGRTTTDYYHFHWNYWWIRHALSTGLDVYLTNYVLAPFTNNLAFHTLTPFFYPIWALLEPLVGTIAAMDAICVTAMTLSASAFYLLLRREGVSVPLALVGGTMLELTPLMLDAVYWTDINLMGWFWLPLLVLIWGELARFVRQPRISDGEEVSSRSAAQPDLADNVADHSRRRRAFKLASYSAALGVALWGMVLTDLEYPLLNAFVMVPYGLLTLARSRSWRARFDLVSAGLAALGIALVLLWFLGPLPYILSFDRGALSPTPVERAVSISFPLGYIWHQEASDAYRVSVGAVLLPLMLAALGASIRQRHPPARRLLHRLSTDRHLMRWFWLALVPLPLILSAGASVTMFGTTIALPYVWLHDLLGGMFRYPQRFVPVFLIPGVLFAMLTLTPILAPRRRARWVVPTVLMFLVMADARLFKPLPIQPVPTSHQFYEAMGRETYDYVVVEVPTAAMSGEGIVGEPRFVATQFYGMVHGKRMVNGHISRVPITNYWYLRTDDPMMAWLGQRRLLEPDVVEQQMRERIFSYPIGYFVIHRDFIGLGSTTEQEVVGYFNSLRDLVCPVWVEGDAIVYRTVWHPDGCPPRTPPETSFGVYTIDVGSADDLSFLGWGWHYQETISGLTLRWSGEQPGADVFVDLPPGAYTITVSAQAFWEPRQLRLLVNGQVLDDPVTVSVDALHEYRFELPASVIGDGSDVSLALEYDATVVPADVEPSDDRRKLAVAVDWIRFSRLESHTPSLLHSQ